MVGIRVNVDCLTLSDAAHLLTSGICSNAVKSLLLSVVKLFVLFVLKVVT